MIRNLTRQHIAAELSALNSLLETIPDTDLLGRMSLESRRGKLQRELDALEHGAENRAKVALYFGGEPVVGSVGLEAGFGAESLGNFQDLISKVWASATGNLAAAGPIVNKSASQLHITSLLHGSFGFLLEELDEQGEPMFESSLQQAANRAVEFIETVADEDEVKFTEMLELLDQRVFKSVREFFGTVYRAKATFRLVENETDIQFDRAAIERAWLRIEASDVDEQQVTREGELLGMIPVARRFEFQPDGEERVIEGKVGEWIGQSYLERMHDEQFAGRRWKAVLICKTVERRGRRPTESWTLLELSELDTEAGER